MCIFLLLFVGYNDRKGFNKIIMVSNRFLTNHLFPALRPVLAFISMVEKVLVW